jgi:F-type H+-transporting ATPase subunit b
MDVILHQLGELLLRAVPTVLLLVVVHFYLKNVFFKPLEKVLHQRYQATAGARKLAQESLERAAAKATEYEIAMRAARAEVYQAQEQVHRQLQERETQALGEARRRVEAALKEAKAALAGDVDGAKQQLAADSDLLADQIAESILRRSAA